MKITRWMATLGLSAVFAGYAAAQAWLESVHAAKSENGVQIVVKGDQLSKPKTSFAFGGKVFFADFNAKLTGRANSLAVNSNGVKNVRTVWYGKPPKSRVAVYLSDPSLKPTVTQTADGWTIWVGEAPAAAVPNSKDPYKAVFEGKTDTLPPISNPLLKAMEVKQVEPAAPQNFAANKPVDLRATLASQGIAPVVAPPAESLVTLDFTNTEVVLILRALADQSGVNIVTSPDVSGRISVSLNKVTLNEALNLVTTIANVRYSKIGKTYLVTSNARFSDAVRQVIGKIDESGETRVITLKSGEGKQIKAAALKAVPQLASSGYYDLILPTERLSTKTTTGSGATSGSGAQGGGAGASGAGAGSGTGTTSEVQGSAVETEAKSEATEGKDAYVLVVGSPERIDEVVKFIEELDSRIAQAGSMSAEGMSTRVVPIYSPNPQVIVDSLNSWIKRDAKKDSFQVKVTSGNAIGQEDATQLLVISGPSASLGALEDLARVADRGIASALGISVPETDADAKRIYEVVTLDWVEPLEASTELESRIRGLSARLMPSYVDPNVKGTKKIGETTQSQTTTASGSSTQGGAGASGKDPAASQSSQAASASGGTAESKLSTSLDKTLGTEPMKLLLYGTKQQIESAKQLLNAIDVEPTMVAVDLRVLDLSKTEAQQFGLDWGITTGGFIKAISLNNLLVESGAGSIGGNYQRKSTSFTHETILDAISGKGNLITRPNTIALDGKKSTIFVGETVRYIEQLQSTQNGVTVVTGKVDVGVTLDVTPRVGSDGTITLNLGPSLTVLKGFTAIPGGGQLPQVSVRNSVNSLVMRDGETVALGGLVQDQDRKTVQGIPFLKDLPLVGRLFRSETTSTTRSEIVFFVTVKIVDKKGKPKNADPRISELTNPRDPNKDELKPKP